MMTQIELHEKRLEAINRLLQVDTIRSYQKIEDGVVGGYKKIETGAVEGFQKVSDKFVEKLFTKEGETVEEAKSVWRARLLKKLRIVPRKKQKNKEMYVVGSTLVASGAALWWKALNRQELPRNRNDRRCRECDDCRTDSGGGCAGQ